MQSAPHRLRGPAAALLLALMPVFALAQSLRQPVQTPAEREALAGVVNALQHADCARAAQRLNDALKQGHPGGYVMAGSMYENGTCLKASWERAERMYLRAHEAGRRDGLPRLIAGLVQGGRDVAAALWWLQQAPQVAVPADCRLAGDAAAQPESFVAALKDWPAARLQGCAYVAGVMAHLVGDADYPAGAEVVGVSGVVALQFTPATGQMQWTTLETRRPGAAQGLVGEVERIDGTDRSAARSLEDHLRRVGTQALARYARPAGLDPAWRIDQRFEFELAPP